MNREEKIAIFIKSLKIGRWPFGIPFGYKEGPCFLETVLNKDGDRFRKRRLVVRTIVVDECDSVIVKDIYSLYARGIYTIDSLRKHLISVYDKKLIRSHIARILESRFYCGDMEFEGIIYPHSYGNIVTADEFDKVSIVKKNKMNGSNMGKSSRGKLRHIYAFRKIITCSLCPSLVFPESSKGIVYYRCHKLIINHRVINIREDKIIQCFEDLFCSIRISDEFLSSLEDKDREDLSFFMDNYREWFKFAAAIDKALIPRLFFKDIQCHGDNITCSLRSPFDGDSYQDFTFDDVRSIINIHSTRLRHVNSITVTPTHVGPRYPTPTPEENNTSVILRMCKRGTTVDQIMIQLGMDMSSVQEILVDLELDGRIHQDYSGEWTSK